MNAHAALVGDVRVPDGVFCVEANAVWYATVEIGHQAVRTLHLANIAGEKKARAALGEDGVTVTA